MRELPEDENTEETPLPPDENDDLVVDLDDGDDVQEIADAERTDAKRVCRQCGRSVYVLASSPAPAVEDLVTSLVFWAPKGPDGERCTVSGEPEAPVWWFCAIEGWLFVRGLFRAKIERL